MSGGKAPKKKPEDQSKGAEAAKAVKKSDGRVEAFAKLAKRIGEGEQIVPPVYLEGEARRRHVRSTLREDHQTRIEERSSGAEEKFDELADSLFSFFRGTALLFYRDLVGTDAEMPSVLVLGDVHPENFGVMPNADNVPIFGVNDFDEVCYAPFTWDLIRGSTGFMLAAEEVGGMGKGHQRRIVKHFLKGYLKAMREFADHATEKTTEMRMDNSPPVIQRLFEQAWEQREAWLRDDYRDEKGLGFRPTDEITPLTSRRDEFQEHINALVEKNAIGEHPRASELKVKDVALRHGQGTASLGLPRYYVMIEGPTQDGTDDIIIEFKRARRSALEGLMPPTEFNAGNEGDRIAHGQKVQLAHGDIFYGSVKIDGVSFMTRERAPFRDDIDLEDLSKKSWRDYARSCGRALAHAHALSDDLGRIDYDIEPAIVEAARPKKLFLRDIRRSAEEAADRVRRDHGYFRADHRRKAFRNIDRIWR
ncbi:DUF2252 domain-containing protein [Oceaniglobus roseus]|uniref:DUF2252 domain-containing protein n=1 Tax=Oceaniglobus roseus TaxID=1737570 RepID=UPI000C7F64B4|nr:DUF2252 family protein [Kandeliimicrobium roseum]